MFHVGDRVIHNYQEGHGPGVVIESAATHRKVGCHGACCRRPYTVRFDSGYVDTYAEIDLRLV